MPKRKNPVFFFPPAVLDAVNREIDEGWKGPHIHHMVRAKYAHMVEKVPSRPTFDKYVKWYLEQKREEGKETTGELVQSSNEIQRGLEKLLDPALPVLDKKAMLEALVRKCAQRIQVLERWQKTTISPQFENALKGYLAEVRNLIETLAKLDHELQPDKSIIFNVVDSKIQPLMQAFYTVLKEVAPTKIEYAKMKLKDEIRKAMTGG